MKTDELFSAAKRLSLKNEKVATMLYVTKIKMHKDRMCSKYPEDIEQLYISGIGWCWKEDVYDYLLVNPKSIAVNIHPFPS